MSEITCPCCGGPYEGGSVPGPKRGERMHLCWRCDCSWFEKWHKPATRVIPCPHKRTTALRCPPTCPECGGAGVITVVVV